MPVRLCQHRGCSGLATYRGRCKVHARKREAGIRRVGKAVYGTKRWKMTRKRKLSITPLCERCFEIATDVHHKRGVANDPWALDGLEALCVSCHSKETRREMMNA